MNLKNRVNSEVIMENKIMVSISCITYNQEDYIEEAIKSFLMQKTNFNYEVLIHDDASKDNTPKIIKKYAKMYPEIIKPIFQNENKYSKGIKVQYEYNLKRAQGKYIAICEGDDFWTDEYKLQKQVDYMENNPDCTLCVHAVKKINSQSGLEIGDIRPYKNNIRCSVEDFIIGGGMFVGTNSILFPKYAFIKPPKCYLESSVGDYPLQIYLAQKGYAYYIDEYMSSYRVLAKNSWSSRMLSKEKIDERIANDEKMLDLFNIETQKIYDKVIKERKRIHKFNSLIEKEEFRLLKKEEYKDLYISLNKKVRLKIFLKEHLPLLYKNIVNIKRRSKK